MIVIPVGITANTSDEQRVQLLAKVKEITDVLVNAGIRAESDVRYDLCAD